MSNLSDDWCMIRSDTASTPVRYWSTADFLLNVALFGWDVNGEPWTAGGDSQTPPAR